MERRLPPTRRRSGYTLAEAVIALVLTVTVSFVIGQWVLGYIQTSGVSLHGALANVEVASAAQRLESDLTTTARCADGRVGGPLTLLSSTELAFTSYDQETGGYHLIRWEIDGPLVWRHTTPLDGSCTPLNDQQTSAVVLDTVRPQETSFTARAANQPVTDPGCETPADPGCRIDSVSFTFTIDGVGDVEVPRRLRGDVLLPQAVTTLP